MYIISRCLLGEKCKYNGGDNYCPWVAEFAKTHDCLTVCPETEGGLPSPRPPAERQPNGRILDREGKDVTEAFLTGAAASFEKVAEKIREGETVEGAVLKANSPSCGCGLIYDGTFTGTLVPGDGCFAAMLREEGVPLYTEKDRDAVKG